MSSNSVNSKVQWCAYAYFVYSYHAGLSTLNPRIIAVDWYFATIIDGTPYGVPSYLFY